MHAGAVLQSPFHVSDQTGQRKRLRAFGETLLDQSKHSILIEMSIAQVRVPPIPYFQLPRLLGFLHFDPTRFEPLQMTSSKLRVNDVKCLFAQLKPLPDEWQQDAIFLIPVVEEGANMLISPQRSPSKF